MMPARISFRRGAIALGTAFATLAATLPSALADAARPNGYAVTNVNLRAGPGTDFPVIVTVPSRVPIAILGCLADYGWCDVVFADARGWMRSIYLAGWYQGYYYSLRDYAPQLGYRIVTFDIGSYWDSYYRDRPFYAERTRWGGPRQEGSIDKAVFYDRLASYGQWVWLQGQYVWVPSGVDREWRPYTIGRWVYTDRNGWMWASNEPFGWATYHYGRWGFSNQVGWFWVPGSRWAPAWVSWRSSDNYLAWAPLPPAYDEQVSIEVTAREVPDYYWQAVPSDQFLSPDLPRRIVRDQERLKPVIEETRPIGNVTINNNVVVNNVVNVQYVEEKTKEKVVVHTIAKATDSAQAGKVEGAAIEVFQPAADQAPVTAAPPKPKKIEEVAAESKTKAQAAGAPSTEELLVPPEVKAPEAVVARPPAPPGPPEELKEGAPKPAEQAAPPPPPPPPPAGEATPPPPQIGGEAPKVKKEGKPQKKEEAQPEPAPPPSPPAKSVTPPPPEGAAPPPAPQIGGEAPKAKKEGKPQKKEEAPPEAVPPPSPPVKSVAPPPPPPEGAAPPPPPQVGGEAPKAKKEGKPKQEEEAPPNEAPSMGRPPPSEPPPPAAEGGAQQNGKKAKKGAPSAGPCPEGTMLLENGSCAPSPQ